MAETSATARAAGAARAPRGGRRRALRREATPWAMVAPVVLLVGTGVLFPLAYIVLLGSESYSPYLGPQREWVGLANYARVLGDAAFWNALVASVIWVVGSVVPQFLLGLGMALVLNETFRGRGLVRTIVLAPWAVSGVVTGFIWLWLFDGTIGVVNDLLVRMQVVDAPVAWGIESG
ncbi:MAG: sugar ABC transporter permease, partial [Burkholderiales bacterium]|nr:sugar ABC transporter permease [Burkholderiales bacterium]